MDRESRGGIAMLCSGEELRKEINIGVWYLEVPLGQGVDPH